MTTKEIIEQMEKELFGYNDRGIVSYSDGLAISGYMTPHAICNNCGFSAKGEEAKEMIRHPDYSFRYKTKAVDLISNEEIEQEA